MAIQLDHTIVPAQDKEDSARFFARIFGLPFAGGGYFAPVQVNDTLTLDFATADAPFAPHHYAFKVSAAEFDAIFARLQAEGIAYGSGPDALADRRINRRRGGRGCYFTDPNGHILEILTA